MVLPVIVSLATVYIVGWAAMVVLGMSMKGPVPLPGRLRREAKTALAWPLMLAIRIVVLIVDRIPQNFERETDWKRRAEQGLRRE